jgi:hypothetical protein
MALGRIVRQLDRVERGRSEESDVTNSLLASADEVIE